MKLTKRSGIRISLLSWLSCAALFVTSAQQHSPSNELPDTTADRITGQGWWPTKSLPSTSGYVGGEVCARCHSKIASTQTQSEMARAAFRSAGGAAGEPAGGDFKDGSYSYRFIPDNASHGYSLEVRSNGRSVSYPVTWTMGAGDHGQTYLVDKNGAMFEGQASSFKNSLGLTPGHKPLEEGPLENGLGIPLKAHDALRCFGCHTTASSAKSVLNAAEAVPGVHCEACHGPGQNHVNSIMAGQIAQARQAIFNPASLTPTGSIDFCGACHRTTMDVVMNEPEPGAFTVRFQPYRLQESRCWKTTKNARLACTECHDPHTPLVRDTQFYDQKCLSCHSPRKDLKHEASIRGWTATPRVCPKSKTDCVTCHMPKTDVTEMHSKFFDHYIRIVRPGQAVPN